MSHWRHPPINIFNQHFKGCLNIAEKDKIFLHCLFTPCYLASLHVLLSFNVWESALYHQTQSPLSRNSDKLFAVIENRCFFRGGGFIWRTSFHSFPLGINAWAGEQEILVCLSVIGEHCNLKGNNSVCLACKPKPI